MQTRRRRLLALVALGNAATRRRAINALPSTENGAASAVVVEDYLTVARATSAPLDVASAEEQLRAKQGIYHRAGKRLVDVVGAGALLLVAAPIMVAVALAIRISLGPRVVYRQSRVGLHGRYFTVYKFRTMLTDQRRGLAPFDGPDRRVTHKTHHDPRLTPLGRFLRKWSLDELPQLWNVLRGDMSLVGPRPELISIVDTYQPWQRGRHLVKPGLTGYWQIYARGTGAALMHECTVLDIAYVKDVGPLVDLKILLLTLPAIVGMHRGY